MKKSIKDWEEKYQQLTQEEKNEFQRGYKNENLQDIKNPNVYELLEEILTRENKIKGGIEMVEKIKKEEEKILNGELVDKPNEEKALTVANKKNALLVKQEMPLNEWKEVVTALYNSGYFKDLQSMAQAITKAQCGRELGFPPYYSLNNFFILPGKPPSSSGQVMAALIKRSGYDYRVVKSNNEICHLKFFGLKGEEIGESTFTFKEADSVVMKTQYGDKKLTTKDNWKNYTSDMLFWRCMARGARRYCPDAIAGLYLKDEIDFEANEIEKADSDLSAFKVETPKGSLPAPENKAEKSRKDILEELVKQYGSDMVKALKNKLKISAKLLDIPDNEWNEFVKKLQEKEEIKDKKEEKAKDEKKEEKTDKKELTKEEKLAILEDYKKRFGVKKIKEIKEKLEIEEKLSETSDKDFRKFCKSIEK